MTEDIDEPTRALLEAFLDEDLGRGDITSGAVVDAGRRAVARVVVHQDGVVAGVEESRALCAIGGVQATATLRDGDRIVGGDSVLELRGRARDILGVERTVLNLLSHMSGIATLTRAVVQTARAAVPGDGSGAPRITATRKTLPGLRRFEKRAVVAGGADPHRFDLSEAVLIKENHLAFAGDIAATVGAARRSVGDVPIEIEVETLDEALTAARAGADILLLDNMKPATVERTCAALEAAGLREAVRLEASGGITIENVAAFARLPIDLISMSAITMAAPPIDFSLDIVE